MDVVDEDAAAPRDPTRPWAPSPFTRLARTHGLSVAGDAVFTTAMAGTVFFSANSLEEARGRVALTLVFTIAPFAVAAPLIGPLLDRARGGRRWMIIVIAALRALVCLGLMRHYDSWLLYPEGLLMLVLSKGYLIARGAMVPTVVRSDDALVKANARLTLLSGIAAAVAVVPAGILLKVGSPAWTLGLGFLVFAACTVVAFGLPKTTVALEPAGAEEKAELRSIGILVAASSMALVRGIVGFLAFLIAFYAKDADLAALLVVGAVAGQGGFLLGAVAAPAMRRSLVEEQILGVCLGAILTVAIPSALLVGSSSTTSIAVGLGLVSLVVGFSSNVAKQAFDSIVQRDAPDANRGRSFARFETKFQLVWVIGALLPTALPIPLPVAMAFIALVAAFALTSYVIGRRRAAMGLDHRLIKVRRRNADGGSEDGDPPTAPPTAGAPVAGPPDRTLVLTGSPQPGDAATPAAAGGAPPPPGLLGMPDAPMPPALRDALSSPLFDVDATAVDEVPWADVSPPPPAEVAQPAPPAPATPLAPPPPAPPDPGPGVDAEAPPRPPPPPPVGTDELADRQPRWRDAAEPHLPGFEPEGPSEGS